MRRQVITAALLGLTLATTSLPALAGGGDLNGSVNTDGPGYDVRTDVDYHHTTGSNNNTPHQDTTTVMVGVRLLMGVPAPMLRPS